jgi:hypothetical protein
MSLGNLPAHVNLASFDGILAEIRDWEGRDRRIDTVGSKESASDYSPSADLLADGVNEIRRVAGETDFYAPPTLSLNKSLPHDQLFFGNAANRGDVVNAHAEYYFAQTRFRSEALDWVYINCLVAYSYERYKNSAESLTAGVSGGGFYRSADLFIDGRRGWAFAMLIGHLLVISLKAGLIFLPFFAAETAYLLPTMLVSAGTIALVVLAHHRREEAFQDRKRKTLVDLDAISRVQRLVARRPIHWKALADEIDIARRQGIGWLSALLTATYARTVRRRVPGSRSGP